MDVSHRQTGIFSVNRIEPDKPGPIAADGNLEGQFRTVMERRESGPDEPFPDSRTDKSNRSLNFGDSILAGMDHVRTDFESSWSSFSSHESILEEMQSPSGAVGLLAKTMKVSVAATVITNGTNSVIKGVEQLTKMQ